MKAAQQHQHEDHNQILDHEPAHGDAAVDGFENAAAFQRPEEHDGAGYGEAPGRRRCPSGEVHPQRRRTPIPESVATAIWTMAPRQGNTAHSQQVVERKMQADAEHQQHHADFGELVRKLDIGDKPRCGGPMIMPAMR